MATIIGIDPGVNGAVAILQEREGKKELVDVQDLKVDKRTKEVDVFWLANIVSLHYPDMVYVERQAYRPGDGGKGICTMCRNYGAVVTSALLMTNQKSVIQIEPQVWKRVLGYIGKSKDYCRYDAMRLWPEWAKSFERVKDHDRAEAALIAFYATVARSCKSG